MKKKRERIINAILFVILILSIGAILYLTKSDILKPKEEVPEVVIPNSGFPVIKIDDLQNKFNKLTFINKKQDFYNKSSIVNVNSSITAGKVSITIKVRNAKRTYEVDGIENAICIHTMVLNTSHVTYILTEDGKVYKIDDNLPTVEKTDGYKGEAKDLGLINVVKIAVDKKLKFKLNDILDQIVPCVYIISDDGRMFTEEKFKEGASIVELVENKKEVKKENASQSN